MVVTMNSIDLDYLRCGTYEIFARSQEAREKVGLGICINCNELHS